MYKLIFIFLTFIAATSHAKDKAFPKEEQLNNIIERYILDNPEILIKSLENYREKAELDIENKLKESIKAFFKNKDYRQLPYIGSENDDKILIEFIDYNCGYCKKTLNTINKLVQDFSNLKIVFIDYPILSESSELAAKGALAAAEQNKYFEFHSALLNNKGVINQDVLIKIAENLGLDIKNFQISLNSNLFDEKLAFNKKIAEKFMVRGTPTFIFENKIFAGAYDYKKLKSIIDESIIKR